MVRYTVQFYDKDLKKWISYNEYSEVDLEALLERFQSDLDDGLNSFFYKKHRVIKFEEESIVLGPFKI